VLTVVGTLALMREGDSGGGGTWLGGGGVAGRAARVCV
jgi:hypothetical protein